MMATHNCACRRFSHCRLSPVSVFRVKFSLFFIHSQSVCKGILSLLELLDSSVSWEWLSSLSALSDMIEILGQP